MVQKVLQVPLGTRGEGRWSSSTGILDIGPSKVKKRNPRWGSGTSFGGTMQGAVDSRFRGNDRWVGMTEGGNDGWAGMADWRERQEGGNRVGGNDGTGGNGPALPGANDFRIRGGNDGVIPGGNPETFATGRLALTGSPGFPLPGRGRGRASGERCKAQWIPAFAGMTGGWGNEGMTGGRG